MIIKPTWSKVSEQKPPTAVEISLRLRLLGTGGEGGGQGKIIYSSLSRKKLT